MINLSLDAQCCEVIITTNARRGKGVEGDPVRKVVQVWTKAGELIAEHDEWIEELKNKKP